MLHLSDLGRLIGDHRYIGAISVYLYVVEKAGLGDTVYKYIYIWSICAYVPNGILSICDLPLYLDAKYMYTNIWSQVPMPLIINLDAKARWSLLLESTSTEGNRQALGLVGNGAVRFLFWAPMSGFLWHTMDYHQATQVQPWWDCGLQIASFFKFLGQTNMWN